VFRNDIEKRRKC